MSLRYAMIAIQGRAFRGVCLDCGQQTNPMDTYFHSCGGVIILVEDENTVEGINRVETEVQKITNDEEHRRMQAAKYQYVKDARRDKP